jgi:preprotein translocase SecY subunit
LAGSIANIAKIPELRRRILFTLGMLAIFRVGVFVTIPGVNRVEMSHVVTKGGSGSFLGMFNMFSGGALEQLSIFALGIMPYITSSIVMQLLTVVVPKLDQLNKEGEQGRRRINQLTRYGTIVIASVQGWFIASYVENLSKGGAEVVASPGLGFRLITVLTLTTGTAFIMWLGELITDKGIGNGSSLIIFAGIVSDMPDAIVQFLLGGSSAGGTSKLVVAFMVLLVVGTIAAICYFERAHRRIPVQYTKRQVGRKMYQGAQSFLPLKINVAGVIPPIFASSILMFPSQIANMSGSGWMQEFVSVLHQPAVHGDGRVLRVLLHVGRVQSRRRCGQLEEERWLRARYSSRQEHRCVYREGADAHHVCGRALPLGRVHDSRVPAEVLPGAVPVRWYRTVDCRWCGARYGAADRVASHHAQLRRVRWTERSAHSWTSRGASALRRGVRSRMSLSLQVHP